MFVYTIDLLIFFFTFQYYPLKHYKLHNLETFLSHWQKTGVTDTRMKKICLLTFCSLLIQNSSWSVDYKSHCSCRDHHKLFQLVKLLKNSQIKDFLTTYPSSFLLWWYYQSAKQLNVKFWHTRNIFKMTVYETNFPRRNTKILMWPKAPVNAPGEIPKY